MKYLAFRIPDMTGTPTRGLMLLCAPGDKWYETIQRQNREEIETLVAKILASIPVPSIEDFEKGTMSVLAAQSKDDTCFICLFEGQHSGDEVKDMSVACFNYCIKKQDTLEDVPDELYEPENEEATMEELLRMIEQMSSNEEQKYRECYVLPSLTVLYQFKTLRGTVRECNGTYYLFTNQILDDFFEHAEVVEGCINVISDVSLLYQKIKNELRGKQ